MSKYLVSKVLYDILVEEENFDKYMSYVKPERKNDIESFDYGQWRPSFSGVAYGQLRNTYQKYLNKIEDLKLHPAISENRIIKKESVTFEGMSELCLSFVYNSFWIHSSSSDKRVAILVNDRILLTKDQSELIFHRFDSSVLDSVSNGENKTISPYFDKVFSEESLKNIKEAYAEQTTKEN